jgi:outer membrane protein assembly factor BamA
MVGEFSIGVHEPVACGKLPYLDESLIGVRPPNTLADTIAEVRVHGNHLTSDEEIVKLAGITIGAEFGATTIADITKRLKDAKRFDDVQVLKRFASIADPTQIVIVIVVNEGAVRISVPDDPTQPINVMKRGVLRNFMFMPILDAEDGYGVTAGVRVAYVGLTGRRSRVSFPLTVGGMRRAGAEFEHNFQRGPLTRVEFGVAVQRQTNPAFDEDDNRKRLWARADRAIGPFRLSAIAGWQRVAFADLHDDFRSIGGEVVFDTRVDPVLPRNAVYAVANRERLFFADGPSIDRTRLDARGYIGLVGQTVLVLRAVRQDTSQPVPPYLKSLLGGWSNLRGFKAGAFIGDTMVTGSVELRVPVSSPLSVGKLGVSVFVDVGAAYDKGQRFRDQDLQKGVGGSVWLTLGPLRLSIGVAHGLKATTRVTFGGGLTF